jgi:cobalt/nickel transport protein
MSEGRLGAFFRAGGITILFFFLPQAEAHFSILLPDGPAARRGQEVTVRYMKGHPYECQLIDTYGPQRVQLLLPDGRGRVELKAEPRSVVNPAGGKVTIQSITARPAERGDHLVLLTTPMEFDEHAGGFLQDEVKLILRVQATRGWANAAGTPIEIIPLTRPYGLEPGFAFKGQARLGGKPLADAEVQIEPWHAEPPREIPADDAFVTQVVRTDINGYFICTLSRPGWWGMSALAEDGRREKDGRQWPVIRRATLWVQVENSK